MKLSGKTSDRIRSGEIDQSAVFPPKRGGTQPPTAEAIRNGKGRSLGDPTRSDRRAQTSED